MNPDWDSERRRKFKFGAFLGTTRNGECFIVLGGGPQNIVTVLTVSANEDYVVWVKDVFSGEKFECYYGRLSPCNAMEVLAHAAR